LSCFDPTLTSNPATPLSSSPSSAISLFFQPKPNALPSTPTTSLSFNQLLHALTRLLEHVDLLNVLTSHFSCFAILIF
jgi:hypothetical protein